MYNSLNDLSTLWLSFNRFKIKSWDLRTNVLKIMYQFKGDLKNHHKFDNPFRKLKANVC